MVDLVLLHGPPASGKLTIANALSALTGARVFHNHLTLDVAKSLFDFGAPGFWDLVRDLRLLSYRSYFEHGTGTAIATWCYEEPEDHDKYLEIKKIASSGKGRFLPVFLRCDNSHLESRVANVHRQEMKKLCDVEKLRLILSSKNYSAIPDDLCLKLDSGADTAESNAQKIAAHFALEDIE